jgi:hypothetical protein
MLVLRSGENNSGYVCLSLLPTNNVFGFRGFRNREACGLNTKARRWPGCFFTLLFQNTKLAMVNVPTFSGDIANAARRMRDLNRREGLTGILGVAEGQVRHRSTTPMTIMPS